MFPSEKKNFLLNNTGSPSSMPCSLRVLDGSTQLTETIIIQYLIKFLKVFKYMVLTEYLNYV